MIFVDSSKAKLHKGFRLGLPAKLSNQNSLIIFESIDFDLLRMSSYFVINDMVLSLDIHSENSYILV